MSLSLPLDINHGFSLFTSVRRAYKATWLFLSALIFLGVFSLILVVVLIVERTPVLRGLLVRAVTCGIAWAIQYISGEGPSLHNNGPPAERVPFSFIGEFGVRRFAVFTDEDRRTFDRSSSNGAFAHGTGFGPSRSGEPGAS